MKKNLFSGTFKECVERFEIDYGRDEDLLGGIASFVETNQDNVLSWFGFVAKQHLPVGENKLKLSYVLEMLGYTVTDLHENGDIVYRFGFCIACNIVSLDEAVSRLNLSNGGRVTRILFGGSGTTQEKIDVMESICNQNQLILDTKINSIMRNYLMTEPISTSVDYSKNDYDAKQSNHKALVISALAESIKATLSLAKVVASDDFSAKDREDCRALLNRGGIPEVTSELSKLGSERARESIIQRSNNPL